MEKQSAIMKLVKSLDSEKDTYGVAFTVDDCCEFISKDLKCFCHYCYGCTYVDVSEVVYKFECLECKKNHYCCKSCLVFTAANDADYRVDDKTGLLTCIENGVKHVGKILNLTNAEYFRITFSKVDCERSCFKKDITLRNYRTHYSSECSERKIHCKKCDKLRYGSCNVCNQ